MPTISLRRVKIIYIYIYLMSISIGDSNDHMCWCFKEVNTDKKTFVLSDKTPSTILYTHTHTHAHTHTHT